MVKLHILCVLAILIRTGHTQLFQPFSSNTPTCPCLGEIRANSGGSLAEYQRHTTFTLYTRGSNGTDAKDASALNSAGFDPSLPLKIITHGYLEKYGSPWITQMKDALLSGSQPTMNVVIVDWGMFSARLGYDAAARHAIQIGRVLAEFLKFIKENYPDFSGKQVHLIGFSMGAHVSGIAGRNFPGIARITGLDPAGPFFQCVAENARLTKDTADFVDVIHTNGGCSILTAAIVGSSIGLLNRAGHQDFFVNGGSEQPGCPPYAQDASTIVGNFLTSKDPYICHHHRAIDYFIESITAPEIPFGYQCSDIETFQTGDCLDTNRRAAFGYNAKRGAEGNFYLETQKTFPYLQRNMEIEVMAGNGIRGTLDLHVIGRNGIPDEKVSLRNTLNQRSMKLYLGTVGIPLGARVSELAFTLGYRSSGIFSRIFSNPNDSLDVVVTDLNSNERYCAKPWRSNQGSRSYSVNLRLDLCSSHSNLS